MAAGERPGNWTYTWRTPASGSVQLKARAVDDSANLQTTLASATVTVGSAPPTGAPTGLTASGTTSGISLDWADSTGATGYNVYRATSPTGTYTRLTGTPTATSAYIDATAVVGTSYYQVTAIYTTGESARSATASAVPGAAGPHRADWSGTTSAIRWTGRTRKMRPATTCTAQLPRQGPTRS